MADESLARAFIRWLDLIPNRHWLVVGDNAELARAILDMVQPSAVTVVSAAQPAGFPADPRIRFHSSSGEVLPFEAGTFDVAVSATAVSFATIAEMRRTLWPAGVAAVLTAANGTEEEGRFRKAGLHAIQSAAVGAAHAVRGTR